MKHRVAFFATCLNTIVSLLLIVLICMISSSDLNSEGLDEILNVCRLSAYQLDSAAFDDVESWVRQITASRIESDMAVTIYSENGQTLFTSRPDLDDTLSAAERSVAAERPYSFTRKGSDGSRLYAATGLADGGSLVISRKAFSWRDILLEHLWWILLALIFVALVEATIIHFVNRRTDRLIANVQRVLEEFSEGQYDSRIDENVGDSIEQIAQFNQALGALQERVFRQRTRNQALSTIMHRMQNGLLAVDEDLNVLLVTSAAKSLLGISGSAEGVPVQLASRDVKLDKALREGMSQSGLSTIEVAARTGKNHEEIPLRLYITPMLKDDRPVGAVALVEDISQLRRLEQVRTDFAANVSHELKTPLTSIKGFVETLDAGAIDNPQMARKFLRIIMMETDRLTRLINDILTVSKLESGSDAPPTERVRIDEVANNVSDMLRILAAEKEVTIHCHRNEEPSYVQGDPDRVEQMLINLIENAIKYNRKGGLVRVSIFNSEDKVNLSVADTGIGIKKEDIPRLFERFYRVDKGRSRSMGGTGLGLAIVKHIVKQMNGMIEVQSTFGEGTEFLITLPRLGDAPVETQVEAQLNVDSAEVPT